MRAGPRVAVALLVVGGASTCTVDTSLDGKRCPCVDGYVCDEPLGRCVRQTCAPSFAIEHLEVEWATPNTIAYRWEPLGDDEDHLQYELLLAENEDDLFTGSGTARRLTLATHPELDFAHRPGAQGLQRSMARDLEPGTLYLARVVAIDDSLCPFRSTVLASRTADEATAAIALFEDTIAPGVELQPEGVVVEGGQVIYTPNADPECTQVEGSDADCGNPVRLQHLDVIASQTSPESPGLSASSFERAFLEMRVANRGELGSVSAELWIWPDGCAGGGLYQLDNFTLITAEDHQIVQVPLSVMLRESDGAPLTFAALDIDNGGSPICGTAIGAQWNKLGQVLIDHIRIRH
jgi:hypothetical protein